MFARTKIALAAALILGAACPALANDSGENHMDEGRAVMSGSTAPTNAGSAYGYAGKTLRHGRGSYALAPLSSPSADPIPAGPKGAQTSFERNWFDYQNHE
jgi:hypothetical protein